MISKKQIDSLVNIIIKKFNPQKIFLFGSYAYGNPAMESDLDLCIITKLGGKRKIELIRDIRKEIRGYFQFPLDILVYDYIEFQQRSSLPNTLEYKISKQGILING
ncbi:MAG: nucleotidyltransferase domain-containing protein [candidate division KSB1 bacterium]|nr:nucleotidyltransferase domain-containing protein [candidate division KSB1 bacterium]